MENLQKYKNQIKEVESLVMKLENGALSIEELSTLESLTRAIHERSIILKYKAFEQKVNPVVSTEEPAAEVSEPKVEAEKKEVVEEPTIDFSMFSVEEEEEAPIQEDIKVEAEPEIIPEPTVEKVDPIVVELKEEAPVSQPGTSFLDRIQSADTSLNARFNGTKLDTLVGAFGLNQKLMYINELFDGSSESFSDAIKSLDSKSSMEDAKETVTALASKFEWDAEEESVIEFMAVLNRRYA